MQLLKKIKFGNDRNGASKRMIYLIVFFTFFASCNSSKMGKANYGKDGSINSGVVSTRCTYPLKQYTKSIDAKVKTSIDSLVQLPYSKFEVGVKQTVTRLAEYTPDGLDIELILFRLCEISLNKGFSSQQTENLFNSAIDAWKKKAN